MLTLDRAKALLETTTTQEHLLLHAKNVSVAMGGMAAYFGENKEHWMAIGQLHDYDYQQYPQEHLQHTEKELLETLPEVTKALESMGVVFDRGEFYTNGRDHYLRLLQQLQDRLLLYSHIP